MCDRQWVVLAQDRYGKIPPISKSATKVHRGDDAPCSSEEDFLFYYPILDVQLMQRVVDSWGTLCFFGSCRSRRSAPPHRPGTPLHCSSPCCSPLRASSARAAQECCWSSSLLKSRSSVFFGEKMSGLQFAIVRSSAHLTFCCRISGLLFSSGIQQ